MTNAEEINVKNYVWVTQEDQDDLYVKGYITDYFENEHDVKKAKVTIINGNKESVKVVRQDQLESCNPAKFNKCTDMAELTHLNEPSVLYNLYLRYNDDMIYTHSGLFLVAINPYKSLPIYDDEYLNEFHSHDSEKPPPHIYATAEGTYRNLLQNHKDQSILVTGESGAGKTENTKKIIQYLSSITDKSKRASIYGQNIDIKILQANPILESFGNAKTIKNNNSSRFGKFIRIFFSPNGSIACANIDYYLLEKSRVASQLPQERNYHVFYQLLKGHGDLEKLGLVKDISSYKYLTNNIDIPHVDDEKEFNLLVDAFRLLGLTLKEIDDIFQMLAVVLLLGNLDFTSWKSEQANFTADSPVEKNCINFWYK
jgi:myosin protein heavy chain